MSGYFKTTLTVLSPFSHILDDYHIVDLLLSLCLPSLSVRQAYLAYLDLQNLNIPISAAKTEGPCKVLRSMGIILDSHKIEAKQHEDKTERIKTTLRYNLSNLAINT